MILFISFLAASDIAAEEPRRIGITDPLPYRTSPIDYFDDKADDPVSHLIRRMDTGEVILTAHETSGYLLDLLKHLRIPVESQTLVFSKTSVHQRWISPKNPRAIYFKIRSREACFTLWPSRWNDQVRMVPLNKSRLN